MFSMKLFFFIFFIWFNNIQWLNNLEIFDDFRGKFRFLDAFFRFWWRGTKFLFSDLLDLFSAIEPLLKIFLSFWFKVLVMFDLILLFGWISGEGVFDFVDWMLIFLWNVHWIRKMVESRLIINEWIRKRDKLMFYCDNLIINLILWI